MRAKTVARMMLADARNVLREPLLRWACVLPALVALLLRWGMPALDDWARSRHGVTVEPYYPLIMGGYVLVAPSLIGFVSGFLFLDERDDRVLDVIRVSPIRPAHWIAYRVGMPAAISMLVTIAGYHVIDLVVLPVGPLLAAVAISTLTAPILALALFAFAADKVSGFALAKALSVISNLALAGWFMAMPWQMGAGVVPSYWPMKIVWQADQNAPWIGYAVAGLAINGAVVSILWKRVRRLFVP